MRSLRLALIAHQFQKNDGQGRVNYEIAKAAASNGHHVTLFTSHCADELQTYKNIRIVRCGVDWLPTQLLRDFAFAVMTSLRVARRRRAFDVVQANGFTTFLSCDIVTAHFVHADWFTSPYFPFRNSLTLRSLYQVLFTRLNMLLERWVLRRAGTVVAVSHEVASAVRQLRVCRGNISVIENGVDATEYAPGPMDRTSFGLPCDVPLAVFVGDIRTARKGFDTVLQSLPTVPDLHIAVAGETLGSPFPELARRMDLADRVHFLGKTNRVAELMRSVDLFVFPSRYEAYPLVLLEAMASGLACVVASTSGPVSNLRDCLMVVEDPNSPAELAAILDQLVNDPALRAELGQRTRLRALALSWERTSAQYLALYESCADHAVLARDNEPSMAVPQ